MQVDVIRVRPFYVVLVVTATDRNALTTTPTLTAGTAAVGPHHVSTTSIERSLTLEGQSSGMHFKKPRDDPHGSGTKVSNTQHSTLNLEKKETELKKTFHPRPRRWCWSCQSRYKLSQVLGARCG